jgi:hypothetical protein
MNRVPWDAIGVFHRIRADPGQTAAVAVIRRRAARRTAPRRARANDRPASDRRGFHLAR